jgi:hypothetical protein
VSRVRRRVRRGLHLFGADRVEGLYLFLFRDEPGLRILNGNFEDLLELGA